MTAEGTSVPSDRKPTMADRDEEEGEDRREGGERDRCGQVAAVDLVEAVLDLEHRREPLPASREGPEEAVLHEHDVPAESPRNLHRGTTGYRHAGVRVAPWSSPGIDPSNLPRHVACVMDGNGRWATRRGLKRTEGHAAGEEALFDAVEGALELGLKWLTVYAFSTENWRRPADEVRYLMGFNERILDRRRDELHERGVRIRFIGRRDWRVPKRRAAPHRRGHRADRATTRRMTLTHRLQLRRSGRDRRRRAGARGRRACRPTRSTRRRSGRTSTTPTCPTPTWWCAPRASTASPTSCSGSWPTASSSSPTCCGPTSAASTSSTPCASTSAGSAASAASTAS